MLLALDIGNTHIVMGLFEGKALKAVWRIRTQKDFTADELAIKIKNLCELNSYKMDFIQDIAVACVVPPLMKAVLNLSERYFHAQPLVVGPGIKTGLSIHYDSPKEVGADRIANAVAAYEKYRCSLIIVDFGTAITFEYVTAKGEYKGGIIVPGIQIAAEALFIHASKLPHVEMFIKPPQVINRNTISAMNAGLIYGYAALTEGLLKRIKQEIPEHPLVIATGGFASLIASEVKEIDKVEEHLVLEGLRILYEKNKNG
ncbi:MAG: type III pantothenate kinase [Candidatus Desulfofervidaceae bacterium]|nr:type III pantothenate kinase [Candidatus Desulfofervidaceae bacterium]MDL1969454.1 type III pantothenate kinase [Candidatus Desulfofervidaceae bacterium]